MLDASGATLSALKPAERGTGLVVRVLDPTDQSIEPTLRWSLPVRDVRAVHLDERPWDADPTAAAAIDGLRISVPAHALRSLHIELGDAERVGVAAFQALLVH